jgi:drug/metabolite transporter (DMT)-like permease
MKRRLQADLALLLCALIWGGSFLVVKDALADASVFAFMGLRFGLATLFIAAFSLAALRRKDSGMLRAGIFLGVLMFAGYALETAGLQYTSASKAAFITGSSVVWVPLLSATFGRVRMNLWIAAGALAAFAGLYFVAVPPQGLGGLNRGDVLIAFCAIAFALHIIAAGTWARRHSVAALNTVQSAMTTVLSAGALMIPVALHREVPRVTLNAGLAWALFYAAVISTALAFALQFWAQRYTTPSHTAIMFSLEPVFAVIIGWLAAGEHLTEREFFGAGLIFVGILMAELKGVTHDAVEFATLGESPKE